MNNYKKWLGFILLMSLVMMACAIGGQGAAEVAEEAEATTEAVEQAAETEVEEAEKAVEEAEAEAEAEVEQAEEAVTKETEEEAEPEEDTTETESAAVTAGEGEKAPLEVQSIQGSLETLSSYRAQFKMTFEGTSSQGDADSGTIDMMIEAIKDPEALHMSMNIESPSMAELGGSATVELYNVDGTTYMQNPEDGSWLSFPSSGETDNIFSQGFFAPDELVELPENATRDPEPQEINGISAWH
jgi:hypothetical protein